MTGEEFLAEWHPAVASRNPGALGRFLADHSLFRSAAWPVETFTLFSSLLGHGGPSYRPEAVYPLQTPVTALQR